MFLLCLEAVTTWRLGCVFCWSNISIPNETYYSEKNLKYKEKISKEMLLIFERYRLENVRVITGIILKHTPQIFNKFCRVLPVQCIAVLLALQFLRGVYLWNIKQLYLNFIIPGYFFLQHWQCRIFPWSAFFLSLFGHIGMIS